MLTLGLAIAFVAEFIRALPWPERWKRQKPWSCNTCMTGWLMLAWAWGAAVSGVPDIERLLASGGIALLTLALLKHWQGLSLLPPE